MHADYNLNMKCHALTGIFEKCATAASFEPPGQSVYDRSPRVALELGWAGVGELESWIAGEMNVDTGASDRINISRHG